MEFAKIEKAKRSLRWQMLKIRTVTATSADDVSRAIKMFEIAKTVFSQRKTSSPEPEYKQSPNLCSRRRFVFLGEGRRLEDARRERRHPLPFACSPARAFNKNKWQLLRRLERQRRREKLRSR